MPLLRKRCQYLADAPVAVVAQKEPRREWWRRTKDGATNGRRIAALPRGEGHAGTFVVARAHGAVRENIVLGDPLKGFIEDVLRVRLKDQALTGAPAAGVHHFVETDGKFFPVVMGVEIGAEINIALSMAQCAKILSYVFHVGIALDQRSHHEGCIDDLAEAELLEEIEGSAENRCRRPFAVDEKLHAAKEQTVGKRELDVLRLQILLQRLDGRVVAPGLVSDRYGNIRELRRLGDRRIGRNENAGGRDGISVGVEFAMTCGSRDVHGPVAGAADI